MKIHGSSPDAYVTLDASPQLFGSRERAAEVLAAWLAVAAPVLEDVAIDLVTDARALPGEVEEARARLTRAVPERGRWWWSRRPRLPAIDPGDHEALQAVARFAYWSIDVEIVIDDGRFVSFFSAADTGAWATYRLPVGQVDRYRSAFPSDLEMPADWRAALR